MRLRKAFTAIVAVLAKNGRDGEVETILSEMGSLGVAPDVHLFNTLIRGYGSKGLPQLASQVLLQMTRYGVEPDNATYERVSIPTPVCSQFAIVR